MKCVCPMGGDRVCPDDCLLAVWAAMPPADRKTQRKPIAERLYKDGFTMEAIATQLGVSTRTISEDLKSFEVTSKPSRPKGGRPRGQKGAQPSRRLNASMTAEVAARSILDDRRSYEDMENETGLSNTVLRSAVAREEGRREPVVERDDLAPSAQQKFDAAIRARMAKLTADYQERVRKDAVERAKRIFNEVHLPGLQKQIAEAREIYDKRQGAMSKETFNKIRRALHPDSRRAITDQKLGEAFDAFMALEKRLLSEQDSPTDLGPALPENWDEWEKMKIRATAERRAKRHEKMAMVRR